MANCTIRHGHTSKRTQSPTYRSWNSMRGRCLNPSNDRYASYGGRGITVCERWTSFEVFLADMGERPASTQLDRRDNDGPYNPSNCRWATRSEQQNNKRTNRRITYRGEVRTVTEWARAYGIKDITLYFRLARGWSIEAALTKPPLKTGRPRRRDINGAM